MEKRGVPLSPKTRMEDGGRNVLYSPNAILHPRLSCKSCSSCHNLDFAAVMRPLEAWAARQRSPAGPLFPQLSAFLLKINGNDFPSTIYIERWAVWNQP